MEDDVIRTMYSHGVLPNGQHCCGCFNVVYDEIGLYSECNECGEKHDLSDHLLGGNLRIDTKERDMNDTFDFGAALRLLKDGKRVARVGWNGKRMWLVLIDPGNAMHTSAAGSFDMQPCIGMKTADGNMQPGWLASQADMLSDDWSVVEV